MVSGSLLRHAVLLACAACALSFALSIVPCGSSELSGELFSLSPNRAFADDGHSVFVEVGDAVGQRANSERSGESLTNADADESSDSTGKSPEESNGASGADEAGEQDQAAANESEPADESAADGASADEAAVSEEAADEDAATASEEDASKENSVMAEIGAVVGKRSGTAAIEARLVGGDYTSSVGEMFQNDFMAAGCEIVSLGIVLESMGISVDFDTLVHEHLNMDGNFSTGYAGDPYWEGGGFAPGITSMANGYLESIGSELRASDLTGASFDVLADIISRGYPVLVWSTMGFDDPYYEDAFEDEDQWYSNEHCVVLYGLADGVAYVSDPLEGYVERDADRFAELYELCGSRAVVVS